MDVLTAAAAWLTAIGTGTAALFAIRYLIGGPQVTAFRERFPATLTRVLDQPEVRTEIVDEPVCACPLCWCEWCQMDYAACSFTVYWTPRADVLSDGVAECCQSCAPECIRRAVDDALPTSTVTVEIAGGGA